MVTPNTITYEILPTGGIVKLRMQTADATGWSFTRTDGVNTVVLYQGSAPVKVDSSGNYCWVFLDLGDGTNMPLDPNTAYTYIFTTANSTVSTPAITPNCSLSIEMDPYLPILMRVIQAGVNSALKPASFRENPTVQIAMPLTGVPTLPIISIAPVLMQQTLVPIGNGVNTDYTQNYFSIYEQVKRRYSISVASKTTEERDFYSTAIVIIFKSMLIPILNEAGVDSFHSFQVSYTQDVENEPAFYLAEVSLEFDGGFGAGITTNYGPINAVVVTPNPEPTAVIAG
jgi:hypothetical protein